MNANGKHRSARHTGRHGAAALMIGGLVAGVVATAGAVTLNTPTQDTAGDARPALRDAPAAEAALQDGAEGDASFSPVDAAQEAAALMSLRSASLDQLREQVAADRSEARSAPSDAATTQTLLSGSGFTGRTVAVAPPAPAEEPVATAAAQEATVATTATPEQDTATAQAAPAQAAAAQRTETGASSEAASRQTEPRHSPPDPEPAPRAPEPAPRAPEPAPPAPEPAPRAPEPAPPAPEPAPAPPPATGGVLGIAASYVGHPYQLHGTPPHAFDCSGFTWWVYKQAGITIPRSVAGQRGAVTPVSNPRPGDLVIYNDWHHVGIYAGNGMTYEALNPGTGVRYGPILSSNVWYGRLG